MVAITPTLCAACSLCVNCFHCVTLCYQPVYPIPLCSLAFFKWDDSVNGVEPPPALDLYLVLSISFFYRSCVYPKLSVVGRRRFRPVRVLATC